MAGVGVIFNPNAKRYKKNPDKLKRMAFIIGEKASGKPTQDLADLHVVADEFKTKDIDILAISGGDGTIHCTLTAFLKVYGDKPLPKIVLLRGGTQNNIANNFGIKGDTEQLLSNLLLHYHEDPSVLSEKELRLMRFSDEDGRLIYGSVFGVLAGSKFMDFYYEKKNLNPWAAIRSAIELASSAVLNGRLARTIFERVDAEVLVDGQPLAFANFSALVAGTVTTPGVNFKLFRLMKNQNEKFHFLGMSTTPREVLPLVPRFNFGHPPNSDHVTEALALDVKMSFKTPQIYCVDGDMIGPVRQLRIEQGPVVTLLL